MSDTKKQFGARFQAVRESLKLSKAELADALGFVSPESITLFEGGASKPSPQSLIDLAEKYAVDLHELLTGEPAPAVKVEVEALRGLKHEVRLLLGQITSAMNQFGPIKKKLQAVQTELNKAIKTKPRKDNKDESGTRAEDN